MSQPADRPWLARSLGGMVASASPEASAIGAAVLDAGGNAFDAAVATSLALAVARPQSTGLGGGGFAVFWLTKENRAVALDFREVAPAGATAERYVRLLAECGDGPAPSIYGGDAIGVPGQVAGLAELHRRYGARPWADVVRPAATLARDGFTADRAFRGACREALEDFEKWPQLKSTCAALYDGLLNKGLLPELGARVRRPDLGRALDLIAEGGADAMYRGPIGAAMVRAAQAAGGVLTEADLAAYRVREREPLRAVFRGHELITMPPPSSGGVCLVQTLNILDVLRSSGGEGRAWAKERYPLDLVTALRHAFADRARWLADPDFAPVPVTRLVSPAYAAELAARKPQRPEDFGSAAPPDDRGTSHYSVVDRDGNLVALTETINGNFGSFVVAEPFGLILNNQMDDFTTNPGQPNLFGLVQGEANRVAPGKRPLSSMTPTIVLKDGRPVLTLGASGGPRIITAVTQVLLGVVEFGQPLEDAIGRARLHHQWLPDVVYFDRDPPPGLPGRLAAAGLQVSTERRGATLQAIQILPDGTRVGACEPGHGGRPAGSSR